MTKSSEMYIKQQLQLVLHIKQQSGVIGVPSTAAAVMPATPGWKVPALQISLLVPSDVQLEQCVKNEWGAAQMIPNN